MHRQLIGTGYERIPRDISCVFCQHRYHREEKNMVNNGPSRGLSCSALPFQYRNGHFYLRCLFQLSIRSRYLSIGKITRISSDRGVADQIIFNDLER